MTDPIYFLYVDPYHLDDPFFLSSMAQRMKRVEQRLPPLLILHNSGEQAERVLEAEGLFPGRVEGRLDLRTSKERAVLERAMRDVNRRIVGTLTDEGVHAVGFHGLDRGILRIGAHGQVSAGRVAWLRDLVLKRVVSVLSTLVRDPRTGHVREESMQSATLAMARALNDERIVVVFFTRNDRPGIWERDEVMTTCPSDALSVSVLPQSESVCAVVAGGFPVLITSPKGLFGGEKPLGTWIIDPETAQKT
ncbi:MAG: hypothetical protein ACE5G0_19355 [Rhodothermales bacterium]